MPASETDLHKWFPCGFIYNVLTNFSFPATFQTPKTCISLLHPPPTQECPSGWPGTDCSIPQPLSKSPFGKREFEWHQDSPDFSFMSAEIYAEKSFSNKYRSPPTLVPLSGFPIFPFFPEGKGFSGYFLQFSRHFPRGNSPRLFLFPFLLHVLVLVLVPVHCVLASGTSFFSFVGVDF